MASPTASGTSSGMGVSDTAAAAYPKAPPSDAKATSVKLTVIF